MKIFEFVDSVQSIIAVAELVKNDSKDGTAPMADFLYALTNAGISMDYDKFKSVYDSNPQLKNSIQQFDGETITFVGGEPEADAPAGDIPPDEKVGQMAKRAMNKRESKEMSPNTNKATRVEGKSPHKKGTAKYKKHMAAMHAGESVAEGTGMGTIGDVEIKQFGMGKGQLGIQLTSKDGYVQLNREEAAQLAARLAKWAGSKDMAYPGEYDEDVQEGYYEMPPMDRDKYQERDGLEGHFQTRSGKLVYYDPKEGSYYDPTSDMYLSYSEFMDYDKSKPSDFEIKQIKLPQQRSAPKREDTMEAIWDRFKTLIK